MTRTVKCISIVSALLLTAALVTACRGPHRGSNPEKRMNYAVYFISGELEFNEDQKSQLNDMKDEIVAKMKEHRAERENQKSEIASLVRNNEITEEKIDEIFEEHQQHMEAMKPFVKEKILEFNAMLDDDQRNKVADFIEKGGPQGKM